METKSYILRIPYEGDFIQQIITGEEVKEQHELYFDFAYQLVKGIPPVIYQLNLN